jgi:predicted dehydrogenase
MASRATRREFLQGSLAAGAAMTLPGRRLQAASANNQINVGLIGCGNRGGQVAAMFQKLKGVNIAGLCDPDAERVAALKKTYPKAKTCADLRELIDSPDIDAVIVATCNHWHALAAIWAMRAGKDVYVEKPLANTHWEGQQVVAAAKKWDRICQVGTQQRSDPMQADIKKFLHEDQTIGNVLSARVNRYGVREPIGKRTTPLELPKTVNYDLWLGPAQDEPIYRTNLHYDWHWMWNTGTGEMGNWGVHVLDDLRNNVFRDQVAMPTRIFGGGGRVAWNDAGETPNIHFAHFEADGISVLTALCNLPAMPGSDKSPPRPGPGSGYIAYCEGGRLEGQRGSAVAFDKKGKEIKKFSGSGGNDLHQQNFIDAVRRRDPKLLMSSVEVALYSTAWCHLANIACLVGDSRPADRLGRTSIGNEKAQELLSDFEQVLSANNVSGEAQFRISAMLELDSASERFVGRHADEANKLLTRQFRVPFVVPEIAAEPVRQAQRS